MTNKRFEFAPPPDSQKRWAFARGSSCSLGVTMCSRLASLVVLAAFCALAMAKDPLNYVLAEVYTKLRSQALGATAKSLRSTEQTFGVIVETGYPETVVTLVALSDGTASLYFSNGGGMIGLGQHRGVAVAAQSLISFAGHNLNHLARTTDTPLPRPGYTRFYVLTQNGTLTAEAKEIDLGENRHVLSSLFYSAQELITEMRNVEARK